MNLASQVDRAEAPLFADGFGERVIAADAATGELLQILRLRPELPAVPSFEFALRERTGRLANFRHAYYARVRRIDRVLATGSLAIVSDHVEGTRLSDILRVTHARGLHFDTNAALCLIRQLVPAVALLHENARDASHGSIAPERIVVTPNARVVIVEHVAGSAIEQLQYSRERLWQELRIAMPSSAGVSRFDHRADVNGIGVTALSLVLGRPLAADEFPHAVPSLLMQARERSSYGEERPLSNGFRNWLARTLQLDVRRAFASAPEAFAALEDTIAADTSYIAAPVALEAFLSQYMTTMLEPIPAAPVTVAATPTLVLPAAHAFTLPQADTQASRAPLPAKTEAPQSVSSSQPNVFELTADGTEADLQAAVADTSETPVRSIEALPTLADLIQVSDLQQNVRQQAGTEVEPEHALVARESADHPKAVEETRRSADTTLESGDASDEPAGAAETDDSSESPGRSKGRVVAMMAAVVLLAGAAVFWMGFGKTGGEVSSLGTLVVQSSPAGAEVVVDGISRGMTPARVSLTPGSHILELRGQGVPRVIPFQLAAGGQVSQYLEFADTPATGLLVIHSQPEGATVTVDGVARGTTPLTLDRMTPGDHEVVVQNDKGSSKHIVKVLAGTTASLVAPVIAPGPEGPVSGWLSIKAPVTIEIHEGGQLIGTTDSDRLMLAAGRHTLEFVNQTLGYRQSHVVHVTPGKVTPFVIALPKGTLNLNATPWAEVWIDGTRVGETPIGNLEIPIGPHEIVFRHPQLGERRHAVSVTSAAPVRLSVPMQ